MKSLCLKSAASLCALALLASCGSTAKFSYPDKMDSLTVLAPAPLHPQRVAVLPFEDCRPDENQIETMSLYYVPFCPFGWTECERPENGSRFPTISNFSFNPSEDLAKAAALSLRRSNLFSDVFFTYGGEKDFADFTLEGEIRSTCFEGRVLSYCFSIYSCIPWAFGAPSSTSLNRLELRLLLKSKSGRILWERSFTRDDYVVQWLYARREQDVKMYAPLMRQAMNEGIADLASRLRSDPGLLKQP
jgi:hypothetical protein